jgi:hypothetical protein
MLQESDDGMGWLRHEYHLSDTQFAGIQEVHRAYAPTCELLCEKITNANSRLGQIMVGNKSYTLEVEAAMKECLAVQGEGRLALLAHVYDVSAEMSPADGARYLEMMKSRIIESTLGQHAAISDSAK